MRFGRFAAEHGWVTAAGPAGTPMGRDADPEFQYETVHCPVGHVSGEPLGPEPEPPSANAHEFGANELNTGAMADPAGAPLAAGP